MRNVAIIPARSGSKGLRDKNIKDLCGKPLMAYSIKAAIDSEIFSKVMVSTDSEEYAIIARKYGAEVPFLRSAAAASDEAATWAAVLEVLDGYKRLGEEYDTFCLLQPTSPVRTSRDIRAAYEIYDEYKASAVVSMVELEHPLSWCGIIEKNGSIQNFIPRGNIGRRQVQEKYYRPNGAIYIQTVKDFYEDSYLYRKGSYAYVMPKERSVDVDTEFDFRFAEFLIKEGEK